MKSTLGEVCFKLKRDSGDEDGWGNYPSNKASAVNDEKRKHTMNGLSPRTKNPLKRRKL